MQLLLHRICLFGWMMCVFHELCEWIASDYEEPLYIMLPEGVLFKDRM